MSSWTKGMNLLSFFEYSFFILVVGSGWVSKMPKSVDSAIFPIYRLSLVLAFHQSLTDFYFMRMSESLSMNYSMVERF